ncbi:MAG: glycoside hydrolase family 31 protein [Bacilli bacterium]|nr:glycoside hydrolase family 31 protein [Bacilli bacterium]
MNLLKKAELGLLSVLTAFGTLSTLVPTKIMAAEEFRGQLETISSVVVDNNDNNIVYVNYNNQVTAKITFLDNGIFRYNVDPTGKFAKYATPNSKDHKARIQQYPDESDKYTHPEASVSTSNDTYTITSGETTILLNKDKATMKVMAADKVVLEEKEALIINNNSTVQTLVANTNENFYGGGTQNGRFVHTGEEINVANESGWTDGQVSSPNPFYWSTAGYGVLRNTFASGKYNFGKADSTTVNTTHNEAEFDAYYFVSDASDAAKKSQELLQEYFKVTGNPVLLPEYGFYEGHLNCYNRDAWADGTASADPSNGGKVWKTTNPDGSEFVQREAGGTGYNISAGLKSESLVGKAPTLSTENVPAGVTYPDQFSMKSLIDRYLDNDMPVGYFVPNDGYGCGYGRNGYNTQGGVDENGTSSSERIAALDANVANLQELTKYANSKGVATGLWTQSLLTPDTNSKTSWHLLRDFEKEVTVGGITTLKTDVAWVGPGYSMQLDGVKKAYDIITTKVSKRPNIISLDGWAGSQRFNSVWTGDQYGGSWEYIRFHIPTYIGQGLAGNPNVGSDMDGIFGGAPLIATRDYQWKAFTPQMLNMDGWGSYAKTPYTFADPYKSTSRMYLKLKAQLMPYFYTAAASAANIDTNNGDAGLPMIRAMFLQYPNDSYAYSKNMQYQYMLGDSFLVAPIYKDTKADEVGNDIRNDIYLPAGETWIDYFTGKQYRGGTTVNNFDAPLWKLPLFVKNGSIVPMYDENNTASEINKANRTVEFWPAGESDYTVFEDDGSSMTNTQTPDSEYGKINNISYGDHASTTYTSKVDGDTATLTASKATGTYKGFDANKNTTFVTNVSKEPTSVVATNGNSNLDIVKVTSKAEFDAAKASNGKAVYFYDANPTIETYANESESTIKEMVAKETVSPKLYVKFATTDATQNVQKLVINGFVNDGNLAADTENQNLSTPANLKASDTGFDHVTLTWDEVADAEYYEVRTDEEIIQSNILAPTYTHEGLSYLEDHKYEVRAVNAKGYSKWSDVLAVTTADDPYRNVPKEMSVSYDYGEIPKAYSGKFEYMVDGNDLTEYSSADSGVWNGKSFTIDMNKVYTINKLEYAFRKDGSNGSIKNMKLSYSNDGVTWKEYKGEFTLTPASNWPTGTTSTQNAEARYATFDLSPFKARYLKVVTVETAGGYLQAYEIRPYHEDGENGLIPGDFDQNGVINGNDEVWIDNHHPDAAGTRKGEAAYELDAPAGAKFHDLNENGIFDAADITALTSKLEGGIKDKADARGILAVVPSANNVKSGDEFTVDIYGSSLKNVYAFDFELPFNKGDISTKDGDFSVVRTTKTPNMKIYEHLHQANDKDRAYATFTNIGSQATLNGDMKVASVKLKAAKDLDLSNLNASFGLLVGSSLNVVNAFEVQQPEAPVDEVAKRLVAHQDIIEATAKSTGPTGDGNDIWASLDNDTITYTNSNYGSNGIANAHPQVYTFKLAKAMDIFKVNAYPRNANQLGHFDVYVSANGSDWTKVGGKDVTETGKFTELTFEKTKATYVKMELIPATEDGNCVATTEVEIWSAAAEPVTGIEFAADNATELFVGRLVPFKANVIPEDAANQLYTMTSDNEFVKVITSADSDGYNYSLLATKAGETANITVTSASKPEITATTQVTVSNNAEVKDLQKAINDAEDLIENLYTADSYARVSQAVTDAKALLANGTQDQIDTAELAIRNAMATLEFKGSDTTREDSAKHINEKQLKIAGSTTHADSDAATNVLDNKSDTIYHSTYATGAKLPVFVTVDLGYEYDLEQVDYLARQNSSNGDITHYRVEVSTDGKDFTPVVEDYLSNNGSQLNDKDNAFKIKFAPVKARYVKFIAIESIGDLGKSNNKYASISELDFYGVTEADITAVSFVKETEELILGNELQLTPITTPSNSSKALTWSSSDESIATVDQNGKVTAIKNGEVTITASASETVSADVKVTITGVDKSTLNAKITELTKFNETVKDKKIAAYLTEEIAKAEALLDEEGVSQDALDTMLTTLNAAKTKADSAIKALADIDALVAIDLSEFDPAGQDAFKTALDEAKELAKDPITNYDALISKVEEATTKKDALVRLDVTKLNTLIAVADKINLNKYLDGAEKDKFEAALAAAKKVAATPISVTEIENAEKALTDAEGKLVLKATDESKASLSELLDHFTKLDQSLYTEKSAKIIADTLKQLEEAIADESLSEADARALLEDAATKLASLEKKPTDTTTPVGPGNNSGTAGSGTNTGDTTNANALFLMLLAAVATIGGVKYKNKKELTK